MKRNYRSMSMDELAGVLQTETNHKRFIEATKAFVTKWLTEPHYTDAEMADMIDKAATEGFDQGHRAAEEEWRVKLEDARMQGWREGQEQAVKEVTEIIQTA